MGVKSSAFFLCDDCSNSFPCTTHIWCPIITLPTTISNFCIHMQQHIFDGRQQALSINCVHLVETNEILMLSQIWISCNLVLILVISSIRFSHRYGTHYLVLLLLHHLSLFLSTIFTPYGHKYYISVLLLFLCFALCIKFHRKKKMWISPTGIEGELLFVRTVSTFICQDAETVATSNFVTYLMKNM